MFETIASELNGFEAAGLGRVELAAVTTGIGRVRGALDALEIRVSAAVDGLGDDGADAESMMRSQGRVSKREAARRARRAKRLKNMPNAAEKLANGTITAEHADELAKAAEQTSEAEVDSDEDLLADAEARPADMAQRDIRDWIGRHQTDADRAAKHCRQRDRRSLAIFDGDDDMTIAHCRTDKITGEQLRARIDALANQLHRQDTHPQGRGTKGGGNAKSGGRSTGIGSRTWDQLRHDALMILTGIDTTTHPNRNGHNDNSNRGDNGQDESGGELTADAVFKPAGSVRNQIVVVVDADVLSGRDPDGRCEIAGVGPIPRSVLERLACDADIFGHIFNTNGVSLWHGRATRTVSPQQWRALVARDRGCVVCSAQPAYCEAHHVVAWLDNGPTDIENLALLCARHHHQLHDTNQQLVRDGPSWHIRPRAGPIPTAA